MLYLYVMIKLKHLLLEVSIDQLKTQFVDTGKITDSEFTEIIDSSGGKSAYATWLTKQVVAKRINAEDIYKYNAYFKVFDRRKREYVFNDINQYKTQQDLNLFIVKSIELASQEQKDPSQQKGIAKSDKYDEFKLGSVDGFDVYELPKGRTDLYGVSCELGSGTEWCTATGNTRRHFDSYINSGPLFIFIKPGSDEKYQFSFERNSFYDKNDQAIKGNKLNLFKFMQSINLRYKIPVIQKLLYAPELLAPDDLDRPISLNLIGTEIKSLPDNLTVTDLNIMSTAIKSLPKSLRILGTLDCGHTEIDTLPIGVFQGHGSLYVNSTKIKSIPDNLTIHGVCDLKNTPIQSLPNNLTVLGHLNIRNTEIKSIPDNLKVRGAFYIENTPLSKKYTLEQLKKMLPAVDRIVI